MNTKTMKILVTVASTIMLVVMLNSVVFADGEITPANLTAIYNGTNDIAKVGQKIMGIVNTVGVVTRPSVTLSMMFRMASAARKPSAMATRLLALSSSVRSNHWVPVVKLGLSTSTIR